MNQRGHRKPVFLALWCSQFLFSCGLSALMFFLPTIAVTNLKLSPEYVGFFYAATTLPFIALSIPVGHFLDTINPKKTLMAVLLVSAFLEIGFTAQVFIHSFNSILIFFASILSSIILLISRLCYYSITLHLFTEDERLAANSRLIGNEHIAQISGVTLMGVALNFLETETANYCVLTLISIAFIFSLKIPELALSTSPVKKKSKDTLLENIYHSLGIKEIKKLFIFFFLHHIFYGMLISVYFLFAITDYSLSIVQISFIAGISSLGNLFASPIQRICSAAPSSNRATRLVFLLTSAGAIALFGFFIPSSHQYVTIAFFSCAYFIFYLTNNLSAALSIYVRQKLAPQNFTLLLGVGTSTNYTGLAMGSLLGGLAGKYAGVPTTVVMAILGMALVGIIAYGFSGVSNISGKETS